MIANLRKSKKKPWQKFFFYIVFAFLAIIGVVFLINANWKIIQRRSELEERSRVLKKEIQFLEEKIDRLQEGIIQTETEDYQVEKLYEEGYFPPGANPVIVLPSGQKMEEEEEEKSFWSPQNWWDWLKAQSARVIQR